MENAPKTFRAVYVETSDKEFKTVKQDGEDVKIPGRNLGRFGFVTSGQIIALTQEEYDAVANDPRFMSPEAYAAKTKKVGTKTEDKTPADDKK